MIMCSLHMKSWRRSSAEHETAFHRLVHAHPPVNTRVIFIQNKEKGLYTVLGKQNTSWSIYTLKQLCSLNPSTYIFVGCTDHRNTQAHTQYNTINSIFLNLDSWTINTERLSSPALRGCKSIRENAINLGVYLFLCHNQTNYFTIDILNTITTIQRESVHQQFAYLLCFPTRVFWFEHYETIQLIQTIVRMRIPQFETEAKRSICLQIFLIPG